VKYAHTYDDLYPIQYVSVGEDVTKELRYLNRFIALT